MNLDIIINLNTRVALVCIFYWKQIESEIKSRQPFQSMINCLTNLMRFCNIEGGILYVVSYKENSWFGKKFDLFSWFEIQNRCHPWHFVILLKLNGNVADCDAEVLLCWFYHIYGHNLSVLCTFNSYKAYRFYP